MKYAGFWDACRDHALEIVFGIVGALTLGAIVLLVYAGIGEEQEWNIFRSAHRCKVVGQQSGSYYVPEKTGYLCDDGVTYWR